MTDRELLQEALNQLEHYKTKPEFNSNINKTIAALRARLAPPEQEPVAWKMKGVPAFATSRPNDTDSIKWDALYTAPPQREWVGLTREELEEISEFHFHGAFSGRDVYEDIETRLKEKNNG